MVTKGDEASLQKQKGQVSVFGDDPAKGAGYKEIEVATDTGDGNEVSQPTDLSVSNPEPGHIPPSSMSLGSVTAADNWGECILGLALEGLTLRGVTGLLLQREIKSVIVAECTRETRHPLIRGANDSKKGIKTNNRLSSKKLLIRCAAR